MDRRQEKRLLYISLLGIAAIVPIAINRWEGPYISLVAILCVVGYIHSDSKRVEQQRGFPVIMKEDEEKAVNPEPKKPE